MSGQPRVRLAVDIGGTFTDVAMEAGGRTVAVKVPTTPAAPERGVMTGVAEALSQAGLGPANIAVMIHGTTLATNAIIERKGARTALLTTEGFRDSVEMAYENRYEQYDINIDKPEPLVPRHLRWPVRERVGPRGEVLIALDESSVAPLIAELDAQAIESVAIGLLHSYANPDHERRIAAMIATARPGLPITLSSAVCPEIREYERLSTACANAYVQPLMASYLRNLERRLREAGFACPLLLMMSGGGLTTLETAIAFPIRLVESGPAGGAILASRIAAECDLSRVLSFDMGGTTAKICLIDDARPQQSRSFEVARIYRFTKGSGLPLRIPVIEMVEIGAGGGSIARVDGLGRINVGPDSAGAEPGPACYGQGGGDATVTDADFLLGRIAAEGFAGGRVALSREDAATAVARAVGEPLGLAGDLAAFGISEVVGENMANAARVHAVERGKDVAARAVIAFGGAAPLHVARLAEKLDVERIVIPSGAGVGSAIGFLRAPIAYEVVRSRYARLSDFNPRLAREVFAEMTAEAYGVVRLAAPDGDLVETRSAFMRYVGQGYEISVPVPPGEENRDALRESFEAVYRGHYGRTIPGVDVEILSWTLSVSTPPPGVERRGPPAAKAPPLPAGRRLLFDPASESTAEVPVYRREALDPGVVVPGPALIAEDQTTTVVSGRFDARIDGYGNIVLERNR